MNPTTGVTPFYLDKGIYVLVLSFLAPIVAQKFGVQLDVSQIAAFAVTCAAFIIGHKYKTAQIVVANSGDAADKAQALTEAKAADTNAATALGQAGK